MDSLVKTATDQFGDWRWRLNNLYHIIDEDGNEVLFQFNWAQASLFEAMHFLNVILKARQLGFTTFIQIFLLDACLFNSNVAAGTIAHTREDAEAFFDNKVKFPYSKLPDGLKAANPATQDSARQLSFANHSSIRIGTSLRGGTFQYLHISEYGKICAKYPEKAREIRTGALNTVHAGNMIFVESTAEGQEGHFNEICEESQAQAREKRPLTPLDFKFHFFPWWRHPEYRLDHPVVITQEDQKYFQKLRDEHGIRLDDAQKAWYVTKAKQQGPDMKREFPSTPKEAFEASIEGAYYSTQMQKVEAEGRICDLPFDPSLPVSTWWDLGMNDTMSIAWVQPVGPWMHFIDYEEDSDEGLGHYAKMLRDKQEERGLIYAEHVWPHDGKARILDETGRKRTEVMNDLGYEVQVVERGLIDPGIEAVRNLLARSRFDETRCARLVKALKSYRKEWDEDNGVFKNKHLHNWACHPADMVRTGAMHNPVDMPPSWQDKLKRPNRDFMTR